MLLRLYWAAGLAVIHVALTTELSQRSSKIAPYPHQAWFMGNLGRVALIRDREDFGSLWQGNPPL